MPQREGPGYYIYSYRRFDNKILGSWVVYRARSFWIIASTSTIPFCFWRFLKSGWKDKLRRIAMVPYVAIRVSLAVNNLHWLFSKVRGFYYAGRHKCRRRYLSDMRRACLYQLRKCGKISNRRRLPRLRTAGPVFRFPIAW